MTTRQHRALSAEPLVVTCHSHFSSKCLSPHVSERAAFTTIAMAFDPHEADIKRPVATPAVSRACAITHRPLFWRCRRWIWPSANFVPSAWFGTHNREPYLFHNIGDALFQPPVITNGSPIGKRRKLAWHRCPMRRGREMSSCPIAGNSIIAGAYEPSDEFGLFVGVATPTADRAKSGKSSRTLKPLRDPCLMMPSPRKGRGKNKVSHRAVPLPAAFVRSPRYCGVWKARQREIADQARRLAVEEVGHSRRLRWFAPFGP